MLRDVFSHFGELEEAAVVMDRHGGGKSKGYGFVVFRHMDDAYAALEEPEKEIDVSRTSNMSNMYLHPRLICA